ncbi:putative T7SS-secreted protein [Streptomyces sp. NPDC047315]|uniref:putative T7SS-secreted protein n=1 Tax=Streptomyces sp. NPDC047315 TaxID=3155142 RepID=UPI0033D6F601
MAARPGDWSPLGLSADPAPGDPTAVLEVAETMKRLAETAGTVHGGLRELQNTSGDGQRFVGKTADALREKVDEHLHRFAGAVQESFLMAEAALRTYAASLSDAQARTLTEFQGVQGLTEDDPQRQAYVQRAEAIRGELAAAVSLLSRELTAAGQRMKMPVSDCEIFWEVFEIFTIIFSVLAIFTGGLLGIVAWAMNAVHLVKVAVDFSQGKANGLQLGLAFLGVLFPSTKGIGGTLKAIGKGLKAGGTSFLDDAARLARLTGTSKLLVVPVMLVIKTGAGLRALPFVLWSGAKFLGRAPGKDWTKITGQLTGGSAKFAAYGKVTAQRLGRFTTAMFLPLNMAEIGVVGYRGAAALAFADRVLGIPQHSLRQMMAKAGDLEYLAKVGKPGAGVGPGLAGAGRTGLFGANPPSGAFSTDLYHLSLTGTPVLNFTDLGFAKLGDLLLSRPGAATPAFTGAFTPPTPGALTGTVPLGTSGLVAPDLPGHLTAGPGGLVLPTSVAGDSALNPLTRLDASIGQFRLDSNLVLPADTALGIVDGARHPAGLSLVTEAPGASRAAEPPGAFTGTGSVFEESTAQARGAVAHAEDLTQLKLPELIALQQGDVAVRGVSADGISFRIGENTDVTLNAETLTSLAFTSRGAAQGPVGLPGGTVGAAPGPAPVLHVGTPQASPAVATPPAATSAPSSVPLRATVVAPVRTTAVSAVPTAVPPPAAVGSGTAVSGAADAMTPPAASPAASSRELALALIRGDGKPTGTPAGLSAATPGGGGVSSRTALDAAGVATAGADARLALDLVAGPGTGRSVTPPAVPAGQLVPQAPVPVPVPVAVRGPATPADTGAPVPPPAAGRTVPDAVLGAPTPVPTRIEGHAAATVRNQLRVAIGDVVTGGTSDRALAGLRTDRYVAYETALAELNAARRSVRETAPSTPGAGSSTGPTRAQTEASARLQTALAQVTEARKGLREAGMDPDGLIGEVRSLNTRTVSDRGGLPGGSNGGDEELARLQRLMEQDASEEEIDSDLMAELLGPNAAGPSTPFGVHAPFNVHAPATGTGTAAPPPVPTLTRQGTSGLTGLTAQFDGLRMNPAQHTGPPSGSGKARVPHDGDGDGDGAGAPPREQLLARARDIGSRALSPEQFAALGGAWSRYDNEFTALQRLREEPAPASWTGSSSRPNAARENRNHTIEWRERRTEEAADDLSTVLDDIESPGSQGAIRALPHQHTPHLTAGQSLANRVHPNDAVPWAAPPGWRHPKGSGATWANGRFHDMANHAPSGPMTVEEYTGYVRSLGDGPHRPPAFVVNAIARADSLDFPPRFQAFLEGIAHRLDGNSFQHRVAVVLGVNSEGAGRADWEHVIRAVLADDRFPYPLAVVEINTRSAPASDFRFGTARNQTLESSATQHAVRTMIERGHHPYVSIMDFDAYPHLVPGGQHVFSHFERIVDESGSYPLMMGGGYRTVEPTDVAELSTNPLAHRHSDDLVRRVRRDMAARAEAALTHPLIPYVPEPNLFVDGAAALTDVPVYRGARNTQGEQRDVLRTPRFGDAGAEYTALGRRLNLHYAWELDRSLPLPTLQGIRSAEVPAALDRLLGPQPSAVRASDQQTRTAPVTVTALNGEDAIRTRRLLHELSRTFHSHNTPGILSELSQRLWEANSVAVARHVSEQIDQLGRGLPHPAAPLSSATANALDDLADRLVSASRLTRVVDPETGPSRGPQPGIAHEPENVARYLSTSDARQQIAALRAAAGDLRTAQAPNTLWQLAEGLRQGVVSPDVARTRLTALADGLTRALPKLDAPDLLKKLTTPGSGSASERLRSLADQLTVAEPARVAPQIDALTRELATALQSEQPTLAALARSAYERGLSGTQWAGNVLGALPHWGNRQVARLAQTAAGTGTVTLLASERRVLDTIRELYQARLAAREVHAGNLTLPNRGAAFVVDFEDAAIPTDLDRLQRELDRRGALPQDHASADARMSRFLGINDAQTNQRTARSGVQVEQYINEWITRTFPDPPGPDARLGAARNLSHGVSTRVPGGGQDGALTAGLDPRHYREHAERLVLSDDGPRLLAHLRHFRDRLLPQHGLGHREGSLPVELKRALGRGNEEVENMFRRIADHFDPRARGATAESLTASVADVLSRGITVRDYFVRTVSGQVHPPSGPQLLLDPGSELILRHYAEGLNRPITIYGPDGFRTVGEALPGRPLEIGRVAFPESQGFRWVARLVPNPGEGMSFPAWTSFRTREFTERQAGWSRADPKQWYKNAVRSSRESAQGGDEAADFLDDSTSSLLRSQGEGGRALTNARQAEAALHAYGAGGGGLPLAQRVQQEYQDALAARPGIPEALHNLRAHAGNPPSAPSAAPSPYPGQGHVPPGAGSSQPAPGGTQGHQGAAQLQPADMLRQLTQQRDAHLAEGNRLSREVNQWLNRGGDPQAIVGLQQQIAAHNAEANALGRSIATLRQQIADRARG